MSCKHALQQIHKSKFWQDKKNILLYVFCLILNLFTWFVIIFTFWNSQQPIALHSNILFGIDAVGDWNKLLILPLFGLAALIIHLVFAFHFYSMHQKKMVNLLNISLLIVQFILLISILLIINL